MTARFVMVSRSPDGASSVPNLGLDVQTAEEKQYFDQGKRKFFEWKSNLEEFKPFSNWLTYFIHF